MNQQIINEIITLKNQYNNDNNTYEIQYLEMTEEIFMNKLKNITQSKWDSIKIIDNKEYINRGMEMNINQAGEINCISKKMLKYKYLDNVKINLFNSRKINSENFNGSTRYERVYKQKNMVFSKGSFELMMKIKTEEAKSSKDKTATKITTYEMNIVFKSGNDERMLNDIFKML